jgi:hypothetical protein
MPPKPRCERCGKKHAQSKPCKPEDLPADTVEADEDTRQQSTGSEGTVPATRGASLSANLQLAQEVSNLSGVIAELMERLEDTQSRVKFLENIPNNDISHIIAGGSNSNTWIRHGTLLVAHEGSVRRPFPFRSLGEACGQGP